MTEVGGRAGKLDLSLVAMSQENNYQANKQNQSTYFHRTNKNYYKCFPFQAVSDKILHMHSF